MVGSHEHRFRNKIASTAVLAFPRGGTAMPNQTNNRETGARHLPAKTDADANDDFAQHAATNRKPKDGVGLTERLDDANEKTRHYDGQNPGMRTPSPATEKVAGAGPALAEHSKDAKAPKGGRQPGAYVKDGKGFDRS
jgi:hypothetical protein